MTELNISTHNYYEVLSISNDSDFQTHLKLQRNKFFMNNYFIEGLEAWKANIDTHSVFNHYKAFTYMCVVCVFIFIKHKTRHLKQRGRLKRKEDVSGKTDLRKMRTVARAYSTKREYLFQEVVYLVIPEF